MGQQTETREASSTPYERLGGKAGCAAVVDGFYRRVLEDEELAAFFDGVAMDRQRSHLAAFLASAAGGRTPYQGRSMAEAHAHLAIEPHHFDKVAGHLVAELNDQGVDQSTIEELVAALAPLKEQIISSATEPGQSANQGETVSNNQVQMQADPANEEEVADGAVDLNSIFGGMLESVPINVMYADEDLVIRYMNETSLETLKTLEEFLPCDAEDVVGSSIDIFHKNPRHQRRMLDDRSRLPHEAHIKLGPETLSLRLSAVHDSAGTYRGVMATWSVITERLEAEREQARMTSMVDASPINTMYAGRDLTISYMNKASLETLTKLEHLLPCKAADIVGSSIDIFHKNPRHQRTLLADQSNLPHRANIKLGGETLDLFASAVTDHNGEWIGTMVTWEVITEKVENERKIREAAEREAAQAADLRKRIDVILDGVTAAASGDLTRRIEVDGDDAVAQMAVALDEFLRELRGTVGKIASNARSVQASSGSLIDVSTRMSATAEETSSQASTVSAAAEEVSTSVETVAAAATELGASIREISSNTSEAARIAKEAVSAAAVTNETVGKLGDSSAEIGKVIKLITSIAQQTNLLALNATIEAARAGDAGKGFAVVANEVKELAKETANATEDIGSKIEAIQADSKGAVDAIREISSIVGQINDIQTAIAAAVEEQTATTNEIGRNVHEAARGATEIAENIAGVAQAAQDTAQGACDTNSASGELASMAAQLNESVAKFKY